MHQRFIVFLILPVLSLSFVFTPAVFAEGTPYAPDNHNKPDPLAFSKQLQGNLTVGEFTGAATYEYPIVLPPGRSGLTPQLSLTYNSQNENPLNDRLGYHWEFTEFSIKRFNKKGVERMYDDPFFVAGTPAGSGELVAVNLTSGQYGLYGQKIESSFAKYEFLSDNSWRVTDKQGIRYRFGISERSRQFDPDDPSRTYQWMLEEIRDTDNNFIRYEYWKDANQIYPRRVIYTGHGDADGPFEVRFLPFADVPYEGYSLGTNHPNWRKNFSYAAGFRVDTRYYLNAIQVYANGRLRREYTPERGRASHIYNGRSALLLFETIISIAETAYDADGNAIALPATTFDYSDSRVEWEEREDGYAPPEGMYMANCQKTGCNHSKNILHWDMTGDGLTDFEYFDIGGATPRSRRLTNDGKGGWISGPAQYLGDNWQADLTIPNLSNKILDFNGDGKTDRAGSSWYLYNNANVKSSSILLSGFPEAIQNTIDVMMMTDNIRRYDHGAAIGDLNGDGLPDMLQSVLYGADELPTRSGKSACLNADGGACTATDLWEPPDYITFGGRREALVADCNMDGLADFGYFGGSGTPGVYINDGKGGWVNQGDQCYSGFGTETNTSRAANLNGDSLMDGVNAYLEVVASRSPLEVRVINIGGIDDDTFDLSRSFPIPLGQLGDDGGSGMGVRLMDLDGDKMDDVIQAYSEWVSSSASTGDVYNRYHRVWMNRGERPYFLKTVNTSQGARIDLEYKTSHQYLREDGGRANPDLPMIVDTVSRVVTDDGLGHVTSLDYFYEDGHYHFSSSDDRGLAGFRVITKTDAAGVYTKTYFHQSEGGVADAAGGEFEDHFSKRGMPYRVETYSADGRLVQALNQKWNRRDLGNERSFPHLETAVSREFTPSIGTVKATAQGFAYDDDGNVVSVADYGEVGGVTEDGTFMDAGDDSLHTETAYAADSAGFIRGMPAEMRVFDGGSRLISHQRYYYDGLPLGQVSAGRPTREEAWLNTSGEWLATERTYNAFGLPITERNPRGYASTFAYDADQLYPVRVTNAKGHATQFVYDIALGQAVRVIDANGVQTDTVYDGLGRALEVRKTDPENPSQTVTVQSAAYDDAGMPRSVRVAMPSGDGGQTETYAYFDGLGRTVEQKSKASGGRWTTVATLFDPRGNIAKTLQPYSSDSPWFEAVDGGRPGTAFTYDALSRVVSAANALGTSFTAYDGWQQTVTDPLGHSKTYERDARGRLARVQEKNGEAAYDTFYTYDAAGNLTASADALGNRREFTYDSLRRRLTQTAPHSAGQPAFVWTYAYDANGNLAERTDPKGQIVHYSYDELDRPLTEDFADTPETEYASVYDEGPYALGRLSAVQGMDYSRTYAYDPWGRVTGDAKTIGGRTFLIGFAYDRLGGLTRVGYPDGSAVTYGYDDAHFLNEVRADGELFADDFDYSPLGQIDRVTLNSGITVESVHDPDQLYRLTGRTGAFGGALLQDLQYTYDSVGNLTVLQDRSPGLTAKAVRYAYDDLYRLTEAAYTGTADDADVTLNYAYDAIGNLTYKSDAGNYVYGAAHPHAVTRAGERVFGYDANGNMSLRDGAALAYDYRDRLAASGQSAVFAYGEGFERVSKTDLSTGNTKYYPGKYYEIDGRRETKFIYAGDLKIAKIDAIIVAPPQVSDPPDPSAGSPDNPVYVFSGTRDPGTSVWLNDAEIVPANETAAWTYIANLGIGDNLFVFYSKNARGDASLPTEIVIPYEVPAPMVNPVVSPVSERGLILSGFKRSNTGIRIDGREAVPVDDRTGWNAAVLLASAENTLAVTAVDSLGQASAAVYQSVVYQVPVPTVNAFTQPVASNPFRLSGGKRAGTGILINGAEAVPLDEATAWSADVGFSDFTGGFAIVSRDSEGQESEAVHQTIQYQVPAPSLHDFVQPVKNNPFTVTGAKGAGTRVLLNGQPVSPLNGESSWSARLPLTTGVNEFRFTAKDAAGLESDAASLSVPYRIDAPALDVFEAEVHALRYALSGQKRADTAVFINGREAVPLNDEIFWRADVEMTGQSNAFEIFTKDALGVAGQSVTAEIRYSVLPPSLEMVESPAHDPYYTLVGGKSPDTAVWINGREVIGRNGEAGWGHTVDLTASSNPFEIKLQDALGLFSEPLAVQIDYAVPRPSIGQVQSPIQTLLYSLAGEKHPGTGIRINGRQVIFPDDSAEWLATVQMSGPVNSFLVEAEDEQGIRSETLPIVIEYATPPPTYNAQGQPATALTYILSGAKSPGTGVWVNGREAVPLNDEAVWEYPATLTGRLNAFTIFTRDALGLESVPVTFNIDYTVPPPAAPAISEPAQSVLYTLSGSKPADTAIWIDGAEAVPISASTTWQHTVSMKGAHNEFSIVARDALGLESDRFVVTVDYEVPAPGLEPADELITTLSYRISGTKRSDTAVFINGREAVPADSGEIWTADLQMTGSENAFVISTRDALGIESESFTLNIRYKVLPPAVAAPPSFVQSVWYALSGSKPPATGVWVNDREAVPLNAETAWRILVPLTDFLNAFVVYTKDALGMQSDPVTLQVRYSNTIPVLNPVPGMTKASRWVLSGTKSPHSAVWVNGQEIAPADESDAWSYTADLRVGDNPFEIFAKSIYGVESETLTFGIVRQSSGSRRPRAAHSGYAEAPIADEPAPVAPAPAASPASPQAVRPTRPAETISSTPSTPESDVIFTTQSAELAEIPNKLKPEAEARTPIDFQNVRIQYSAKLVTLTWNTMPREAASFRIYRSKRPYGDPQYGYTSEFLAEIKASPNKNRYLDRAQDGHRYAYRIVALSHNGEILATSVELHPQQIYVMEDGASMVDFRVFTDVPFNAVRVEENDYVAFAPADRPDHLLVEPRVGFKDGTAIRARFLQCEPRLNGEPYCVKVDEKTLEVYVNERKTRLK